MKFQPSYFYVLVTDGDIKKYFICIKKPNGKGIWFDGKLEYETDPFKKFKQIPKKQVPNKILKELNIIIEKIRKQTTIGD